VAGDQPNQPARFLNQGKFNEFYFELSAGVPGEAVWLVLPAAQRAHNLTRVA